LLEKLYTANKLFGGRLAFVISGSTNQHDIDYVQIGLASLRRWPAEEQYTVEIYEPLAVEVIDEVLGGLDSLKELRKHLGKFDAFQKAYIKTK
jgi:hypothetical protein